MRLEDFDYHLPADRIAQVPLPRRDASRLMVLRRRGGGLEHRLFTDLPHLLAPGDLLVLNDTRVVAARLRGRRVAPGASGKVEALLVEPVAEEPAGAGHTRSWRALIKGARRPGDSIDFGAGLRGWLGRREQDGFFILELFAEPGTGALEDLLETAGLMPTPPYIKRPAGDAREALDRERYQTVFARAPGAVAAPTAGLHFTGDLLEAVRRRGVEIATLTLHVGPGTFQPIRASRIAQHRIHPERFAIPPRTADAIARARARRRRVVAVGTTVTRALEARVGARDGTVRPGRGRCDLFIRPGHRFRVVDVLLTNFHLPRSTLLILVSAFATREAVLGAYAEAVGRGYRFYSYGDAMLIV
ncbi:MAG: tRNA preQ1(34) S-adenosylmethionine ribosyltransferase-isomerase QueA [Planctomycetota bacterium]